MPDHRHKAFVFVVSPLRLGFMGNNFSGINVQRHFLTAMQGCLPIRLRDCAKNLVRLRWWKTQPPKSPLSGGLSTQFPPDKGDLGGLRMTNVGFLAQSPESTSKHSRLGKFIHIQHSTQCLIILNMANLIQVKTAFMLHQDKGLGEFRGLNSEGQQPRLLFGLGKCLSIRSDRFM